VGDTPGNRAQVAQLLMMAENVRGLVEGEAINAHEVGILSATVHRSVEDLKDVVGQLGRASEPRTAALLDALSFTTGRLAEMTQQLAANLTGLSEPQGSDEASGAQPDHQPAVA
jgi:hypothetical protein